MKLYNIGISKYTCMWNERNGKCVKLKQNGRGCCCSFNEQFLLAIVLSVLLWFMASDYPLGIFKTFLRTNKWCIFKIYIMKSNISNNNGGRRGRDHMVVGFTTAYAISFYHHWSCEFESRSGKGVQHYVIKFVSDLR